MRVFCYSAEFSLFPFIDPKRPTALVSVLLRTETNLSAFDLINTQACFDLGFSHLHTCLAIRARILRFLRKFKFQIFGKLQLTKFEWSFVKLATKSAVAFMFFFRAVIDLSLTVS